MFHRQLFYLVGLFQIITMQIVYQESQLNHTQFINCQSGIQIHDWPINITPDGVCSLSNFTLLAQGYYVYTLVFEIINNDIQIYIDGSLYYLNNSQVPQNSYSVQIQHYRQESNLAGSIDIVPRQSLVLQRIFIEAGYFRQQLGFIQMNKIFYIDQSSYQISTSALIIQGTQLKMQLSINNTILSYVQFLVSINNQNVTMSMDNDVIYCKYNLSSLQLYDTRITNIYNFSVVLQLIPIKGLYLGLYLGYNNLALKSQQTFQYFIQITNASSQRIYPLKPSNPKVKIDTNLIEVNDGTHSLYQYTISDISNGNCIQDLIDLKFVLKGNYSQHIINPLVVDNCTWLIQVPEDIQRGLHYKLRFQAKLLNSTLNLEDEVSIFITKQSTYLDDFQQAIYVFVLLQFGLAFVSFLRKQFQANIPSDQDRLIKILTNCVDDSQMNDHSERNQADNNGAEAIPLQQEVIQQEDEQILRND